MSRRGRPPEPTALKLLKGTRADRINTSEPPAVEGIPDAPAHLCDEARAEWNRFVPDLAELGVLSRTDGPAIALYCETYARWVAAGEVIEEHGLLITTDKGSLKANPAVAIRCQAETLMRNLLVEFGCTPSSRSKLRTGEALPPADELNEFLSA